MEYTVSVNVTSSHKAELNIVHSKLLDSLSPRLKNLEVFLFVFLPLTACAYLDNNVMLLVYGYFNRRHWSAIKAVGKTGDCTSAAPRKTWWWHCPVCGWTDTTTVSYAHARSCTLMHTRRSNPNISRGASRQALQISSVKTGTSSIYPATLFYIPHIIDYSHSIEYEMIRNPICFQIREDNKPAHKTVTEQPLL